MSRHQGTGREWFQHGPFWLKAQAIFLQREFVTVVKLIRWETAAAARGATVLEVVHVGQNADCLEKLSYVRVEIALGTMSREGGADRVLEERGKFRAFNEASREDLDKKAPVAQGADPSPGHWVSGDGQTEITPTCPATTVAEIKRHS